MKRFRSLKCEEFAPDQALFRLYVDGEHVATLFEPAFEDMFWYSYRVKTVNESAASILRDPLIWQEVRFTVQDLKGRVQDTFAGSSSAKAFCQGENGRVTFRSLYPPLTPFQALLSWLGV
jgi:hypothetical protein